MLAAQGGHTVLLDLVREPSTHSKVANITDQVMEQHCHYGTMSLFDCLSSGSEYNSGARLAASGRGYQAQKSIRIILESRLGPVIR